MLWHYSNSGTLFVLQKLNSPPIKDDIPLSPPSNPWQPLCLSVSESLATSRRLCMWSLEYLSLRVWLTKVDMVF